MDATVKQETTLLHSLSDLRYEVVPTSTAIHEIESLGPGARITIVCSPKLGLARTVRMAVDLSLRGYYSIPHLAVRQLKNPSHLSEILDRLSDVGVRDIVVLGGDIGSPIGSFDSALQGLRLIADRGVAFPQIGISGYPEGHPHISEQRLREALVAKARFASYVVTQMCFSADRVRDWISSIRSLGIDLPVYIGVPGKVSQRRLLSVASKIGVGDSLRFLRNDPANLMRLVLSSEYDPGTLMRRMTPLLSEEYGVAGFHVYTFNSVAATEQWRLDMVSRLTETAAPHSEASKLFRLFERL